MRRALVERHGEERIEKAQQPADRVVGEMRIGHVALLAVDGQPAGERAAPADLDHVAEPVRVRRFAEDAMVEALAARLRPIEQLHGAVDGRSFLVAGDEEADGAREVRIVPQDRRAPPPSCRRSRPSCPRRRARAARPHRWFRRRGRAARAPRLPAAPRPCGRRRADRGARCPSARRGFPRPACRARRRSADAPRTRHRPGPAREGKAPPSSGVTEGQRRSARAQRERRKPASMRISHAAAR